MNGEVGHSRNHSNSDDNETTNHSPTIPTQSPWIEEVAAVTADISSCVTLATLSNTLTSNHPSAPCAYINIETLELEKICVKLSAAGFIIVGHNFNDKSLEEEHENDEGMITYETPYSLLQSISPLYANRFAAELYSRLEQLSNEQS